MQFAEIEGAGLTLTMLTKEMARLYFVVNA